MADNNGWGRPESSGQDSGGADETRILGAGAGASQSPQSPQQFQQYQPPQNDKSSGGTRLFFLIAIPLLILILIAALLVWKWDDFFGSDDSGSQGTAIAPQEPGAGSGTEDDADNDAEASDEAQEAEESDSENADSDRERGRPSDPDLPDDVVPANAAARNNTPAGDFNNIYTSPPGSSSYTSEEFAQAVRDAFVDAYLDSDDMETNHVLDVHSPVTNQSYEMTCRDNGDYIHCTGGNDANVYIA